MRDYDASFDELLVGNEEKTIHLCNLHMLMIKVYKSLNHQNPSFLWELFARKEIHYNLRIKDSIVLPKALTTSFGLKSISFRGSILWNSTPDVIKSTIQSLLLSKTLKTGLVKFAIVIFVHNFVTLCSCNFFLLVGIY